MIKKSLSPMVAGAATALLALLVFGSNAAAEIKLGILPRLGPVELFTMFNPLAEYLTKMTGEKVSIVIPRDFGAFKEAVRSGGIDIGFANPLIYIQLKKDTALAPLAVSSEEESGTKFRGILIVRADSGIEIIKDLRGKKLVFVDRDSAAGYLFQVMLLKKSEIDFQKDITLLPFAKKQDNVAMAVFNRTADAGGIREGDLGKMKDKVDLSKIKILGYTDYFPNWPVFASSALPKETIRKITTALLKLKSHDMESEKILAAAKLAGFAPVSDKEYDKLRKAARLAGAL